MFIFSLAKRLIELVVLAAVSYYVVSGVQVVLASRAPGAVAAAPFRPAVIVAGTGTPSGPLDADFRARLGHAVALRSADRARKVVVLCFSQPQAVRARLYLVSRKVPSPAISTYVAAELPGALHLYADSNPPRKALLVADSWQIFWLGHLATAEGFHVVSSPVAPVSGGIGNEASTVAVQAAAVAWGRIAGFAQTGFIAG